MEKYDSQSERRWLDNARRREKRREEKRREEKRKSSLAILWCISLAFPLVTTVGCDTTDSNLDVVSNAKALEQSEEADVAQPETEAIASQPIENGEKEEINIEASWVTEEAEYKTVDADAVFLKIKNRAEKPAEVTTEIVFGLLEDSASLSLEKRYLDPGEEIYLEISADEIPVQTTKGICAAAAFVNATYTSENGEPWRARTATENLYYRHKSEYNGLKFFKEKVFLKQFKGTWVDINDFAKDEKEKKKEVSIGRIKKDKKDKDFKEVKIKKEKADEPRLVGMGMQEFTLEEIDAFDAQMVEVPHE